MCPSKTPAPLQLPVYTPVKKLAKSTDFCLLNRNLSVEIFGQTRIGTCGLCSTAKAAALFKLRHMV
jgi:hypothetical protein